MIVFALLYICSVYSQAPAACNTYLTSATCTGTCQWTVTQEAGCSYTLGACPTVATPGDTACTDVGCEFQERVGTCEYGLEDSDCTSGTSSDSACVALGCAYGAATGTCTYNGGACSAEATPSSINCPTAGCDFDEGNAESCLNKSGEACVGFTAGQQASCDTTDCTYTAFKADACKAKVNSDGYCTSGDKVLEATCDGIPKCVWASVNVATCKALTGSALDDYCTAEEDPIPESDCTATGCEFEVASSSTNKCVLITGDGLTGYCPTTTVEATCIAKAGCGLVTEQGTCGDIPSPCANPTLTTSPACIAVTGDNGAKCAFTGASGSETCGEATITTCSQYVVDTKCTADTAVTGGCTWTAAVDQTPASCGPTPTPVPVTECSGYALQADCESTTDTLNCTWTAANTPPCAVTQEPGGGDEEDSAFGVIAPFFMIVFVFVLNLFL